MAGTGRGLVIGALLLGAAALTSSAAVAETIPLPTPAPLPKAAAATPPPAAHPAIGGSLQNLARPPFPADKPLDTPPATTAVFTPAQRAQVDKVSAYLSSVQQLIGTFVQVGPD